jgi:hypothetical protein
MDSGLYHLVVALSLLTIAIVLAVAAFSDSVSL